MQVGFAMVFLTFLARGELREYKDANEQRAASDNILLLLKHREAAVRAQSCEVLLSRSFEAAKMVSGMLNDTSPSVRTRCQQALKRLNERAQETPTPLSEDNLKGSPNEQKTNERFALRQVQIFEELDDNRLTTGTPAPIHACTTRRAHLRKR